MESRTQGLRPRPRKQKKSEAKDSLSEDRHSRGQGQECSRPRPRTKDTSQVLSKTKKVFTKIFQAISPKKRFPKNFSSDLHKILTIQKIVLSSSRGQANFRGLEVSRPRPRTWPWRPRPRTSKCVLEDSTSGKQSRNMVSTKCTFECLLQFDIHALKLLHLGLGKCYQNCIITRGGVLEDVLGLEDVLEDTFWSPWLWPRSLKFSKLALSSARGQHYVLNRWNFVGKRQKPCGKFAKTFFVFR